MPPTQGNLTGNCQYCDYSNSEMNSDVVCNCKTDYFYDRAIGVEGI